MTASAPDSPALAKPPRNPDILPTGFKIAHGMGSVAYGVKDGGFAVFLLIFYNQIIGIEAAVVGTALMIALFVDAFIDPIIGELSDRTRSRWGRRLPWLYTAPFPLAIAWLLLWSPPAAVTAMGAGLTVAWLIGFAIIVRMLVSMCEVPSIALVPELTSDYDERTRVMRYRFLFAWAGGLLMMVLAYGLFFPNGSETDPSGYPLYAMVSAALMVGAVVLSAALQHRRIAAPYVDSPEPSPAPAPDTSAPAAPATGATSALATEGARQRKSAQLGKILGEMKHSLSNRAFLWLLAAGLFAFISQGVTFAMTTYMLGFLWQLTQQEKTIYFLALGAGMLCAFAMVVPLSARFGKRDGAIIAGAAGLLMNIIIFSSYLAGWFPGLPGKPNPLFLYVFIFLMNIFWVSLMMLASSMMTDVVEASQTETKRRSEGLFFAGYFFMQKLANGIGIFVAGLIISLISFPADAEPGKVAASVLDNMVLYYLLAIVFVSISCIVILRGFPISRTDHQARVDQLGAEAALPMSSASRKDSHSDSL